MIKILETCHLYNCTQSVITQNSQHVKNIFKLKTNLPVMPVAHRKIWLFEQAFIIYFKKKDYDGLKYIKRYMQFIKDNIKTRKKSIRFKKFPTEDAEFKFHIFSNLWAICILMICALLWYSILKQKFIRKNDNRDIWNSQGLLMTYQRAVIFLTSQITFDQNKDTGNRKKSIYLLF